jgi:alkylated DNA nucleotide flippase Atl1
MTYGDVAAAIGSRAARAVGTVLAHYGADTPWWRVIAASGHPPVGHEAQAQAQALKQYRVEGTPLIVGSAAYRIDLSRARVV